MMIDWRYRRVWIVLLVMGAALPCIGKEADLFPLTAGARRLYKLTKSEGFTFSGPQGKQSFPMESSGDSIEKVTGSDSKLFGAPATTVETRSTSTDARGQTHATTVTTYFGTKPEGVYVYGAKTEAREGGAAGPLEKYAVPLLWVKLPLKEGAAWEVGKIRAEGIEMATSAQVSGTEDVTVPAGTYQGCWKILYRHSQIAGSINLPGAKANVESGQGTTTVWLAPGVGPVKEVSELTSTYAIRPDSQPGQEFKADVSVKKTRELTKVEAAGK